MRHLHASLALTILALAAHSGELVAKQVAAPPADILSGRVRLPDPAACASVSRCTLLPVEFARDEFGAWVFEARLPIARRGPAALALVCLDSQTWELEARVRERRFAGFDAVFAAQGVAHVSQVLGEDFPGWRVERWDVDRAEAGAWQVRITAAGGDTQPPGGWLFLRDAAELSISAYTTSLSTLSDRELGFAARLEGADASTARARTGQVVVETLNGSLRLALHDDGLHGDGAADDGLFGASLPAGTSGQVRARVELSGATSAGAPFLRTVPLAFPMIEARTAFDGRVASATEPDGRLRIELGALALAPAQRLHVSAEVWGTDAHGAFVPVCWLSRMLEPELAAGAWNLPLFLDRGWIDLAGARAPFALRQVRVQDPDTSVPFDVVDTLPLFLPGLPPLLGPALGAPTPAMLMAPPPAGIAADTDSYSAPGPHPRTLLLVHGYCSGGSIWPAADYTAPKTVFLDPNQNRTHDQFALLLQQAVPPRTSFGVVAHSQGGPAALHLYTYYFSGLDSALGPRRIQSVASPYQGTPLASLGSFACGVNNDMTPAGSTTWLAGIPTWARSQVYYWTTANSGSVCNFLTSLFLSDPEDGTVERTRGQLPGGNSMGHVTGWCHTTGMSNPANYTDSARNVNMNANAAR